MKEAYLKFKAYKDWGIFYKIMSLSLLTSLVLVLATMFALVPLIRESDTPLSARFLKARLRPTGAGFLSSKFRQSDPAF
jgi:hypothetical protein